MGKDKFGIYQLEEFRECFCRAFCGHGPCRKRNCRVAHLDVEKAKKMRMNRLFRVPQVTEEKPQKKNRGSSWVKFTDE